jgi:uncharacterized RDD family membrane protein YckC
MNTLASQANALTVSGTEGVSFQIPLAGPVTRFLAWAIDIAAIMVILSAMNMLIGLFGIVSADMAMGLYMFLNFAVFLFYGILLEWSWRGQTLGKRIMRLRVKDERGLKLRFDQVVLRNLLRVVDSFPALYVVGGVTCLVSSLNQRLGDIAAGTVVVHEPRTSVPDLKRITGDKYNSFRAYPHLEARLRQQVPPEIAALALEALMRRDALRAEERLQVFRDFAEYFRRVVAFPETITLGLGDEQYVRNVVDSIYNIRADAKKAVGA